MLNNSEHNYICELSFCSLLKCITHTHIHIYIYYYFMRHNRNYALIQHYIYIQYIYMFYADI